MVLKEFSLADAFVLQVGLEKTYPGQGAAIFNRIYYWTNGHPYLTQKLCLTAVKIERQLWTDEQVDKLVTQLFLSEEAYKESNLQAIRSSVDVNQQQQALLTLYRQVYEGRIVPEDERSPLQNQLKLVGLVRSEEGILLVRNQIYRRIFNSDWIEANTPVDQSPLSGRFTTLLGIIAVGVLASVGLIFVERIIQNFAQALLLTLLYVIVIVLFGLIIRPPDRFRRSLDLITAWLDLNVRGFFRYRPAYQQYLAYRNRFFNVKGMTTSQGIFALELERVFIDLNVAPQSAVKTSPGSVQLHCENSDTIWKYLSFKRMANRNLAIVGPPGSGKTTLLQHMALTLAAGRYRRRLLKAPDKLPILLFLRDHAKVINLNPNLSLVGALQQSLANWKMQIPSAWFEAKLAKGQCLVMLDGLDEVADGATHKLVVDWVERQMVAYAKNRFIITSRPLGYRHNPLSNMVLFEVCSFTERQIKRFIHNWYLANEIMSAQRDDSGIRRMARNGAKDLWQRLQQAPVLSTLAVNPLLLTMIATIHRYRSSSNDCA